MANYSNQSDYWQDLPSPIYGNRSRYSSDFQDSPQSLNFQNFSTSGQQNFSTQGNLSANNNQYYNPTIYTPAPVPGYNPEPNDLDEPPLLDELEIYPDRILEKTLAVMNPFHGQSKADDSDFLLKDSDIAGPITYFLALAVCLFLSGNKAYFGYVYGLSVTSVVLMYFLLSLMSTSAGVFSLLSVASVIGYCILPMVVLAALGIFINLNGAIGFSLSAIAVMWSAFSASRLFATMSLDWEQQPLIAYPCALIYGVYALLILF